DRLLEARLRLRVIAGREERHALIECRARFRRRAIAERRDRLGRHRPLPHKRRGHRRVVDPQGELRVPPAPPPAPPPPPPQPPPSPPIPSADVISTFGCATSKPRVSVFTERPSTDTIARIRYLPGGSWCTGMTFVKIVLVSPALRGSTSTFIRAGDVSSVPISY